MSTHLVRDSSLAVCLFLALLARSPLRAADTPRIMMDMRTDHGFYRVGPGEGFQEMIHRALRDQFGDDQAPSSNSWRIAEFFFDDAFRGTLQSAAATTSETSFRIDVYANDQRRPRAGPRAILQNDGRKRIDMGERSLGDRSDAALRAALVHEAAHVGDDATCEGRIRYGLDGTHYLEEVLSPTTAFYEGWANSFELLFVRDSPKIREGYLGGMGFVPLHVEREGTTRQSEFSDAYQAIPENQLRLIDFVANESFVANVLYDARGLWGGTGGIYVVSAFTVTQNVPCRSLYTLLGALTSNYPAMREPLDEVVRRWSTVSGREVGTDEEYQKLLDGEGPDDPTALVRPPVPATPPESEGDGLFGQ